MSSNQVLIDTIYEKTLSQEISNHLSDKLLLVAKSAGIGIWEYIPSQNKIVGDDIMYALYATTSVGFNGDYNRYLHFIHPEDRERVSREFNNALETDTELNTEFRIVWPDGSVHFIKANALAKCNSSGTIKHLIGTNQDTTTQKETEKIIKENEAKYHSFFETSIDGIILTVSDGEILAANPAACAIFEMTEEEMCKAGRFGLADVTDPRLEPFIKKRRFTGKAEGEITFIRKDGSKFCGEVSSVTFTNIKGEKRTSLSIRDVTEQVQLRKKIEESEKRFRQIVETAQEGIWMIDENNCTTLVNKKLCEILGYRDEEMLGKTDYFFKHEAEKQVALQRTVKRKQAKTKAFEAKLITKSGKNIWTNVTSNPIFDENGIYKGALSMVTDITDRKLADEKFRENREQLLESQRIAQIGSWQLHFSDSTDFDSNFISCSEETFRIFRLPYNENPVSFRLFFQFVHPDDRRQVNSFFENALSDTSAHPIDYRIIDKDGSERWLRQEAKIITDATTGKPVKMFGTITDITIHKEHELQIQHNLEEREILIAELTKSITDLKQFSYITSHNFKAPLSNLVGLLHMVDYSALTEENKHIVNMFKICTEQLNKTINDLVKILIIRNSANVSVDNNNISTVLDEVSDMLKHEINETGCFINRDLKVENIYFNKSYLESILMNLISNAVKYRSPYRTLKINICTEKKAGGDVLMTVEDNGIGIDLKRHRNNIFGLYQRFHTNADSVGLGLFIVKTQINTLGGTIEVESELNKGTTFFITFKGKLN